MSHRRSTILASLILVLGLATTGLAQERWTWPEQAENLQVLPEDFSAQQLRAVMGGFSRSLGVRCSHCHVGEEGQPLSTYDFQSDENPNKNRAREMLRMLESINGHLEKIEPSSGQRVNMWCHTCHQGRALPRTLEEELVAAYGDGDVQAAIERYGELEKRYADRGAYDFSERPLNSFGYHLLGEEDVDGAIAVFRLNVGEHPDSGNVYDSLAEAYLTAGRQELAEIFYRKSLELDPENQNAVEKLREMTEGGIRPAE